MYICIHLIYIYTDIHMNMIMNMYIGRARERDRETSFAIAGHGLQAPSYVRPPPPTHYLIVGHLSREWALHLSRHKGNTLTSANATSVVCRVQGAGRDGPLLGLRPQPPPAKCPSRNHPHLTPHPLPHTHLAYIHPSKALAVNRGINVCHYCWIR